MKKAMEVVFQIWHDHDNAEQEDLILHRNKVKNIFFIIKKMDLVGEFKLVKILGELEKVILVVMLNTKTIFLIKVIVGFIIKQGFCVEHVFMTMQTFTKMLQFMEGHRSMVMLRILRKFYHSNKIICKKKYRLR